MATREVFWNIGSHWLFYSLAALAVLIFLGGCYRNVYVWLKGWPSKGTLEVSTIVSAAFKDIAGNRKILLGDLLGGLMHLGIMWGFVVLFIGTVLLAFHDYLYPFLRGSVYEYYSLLLDVFGLFFIIALVTAIIRRYFIKAGKMFNLLEDPLLVVLLLLIGSTGFLIEGYRLAAQPEPWMHWSPVGAFLAPFLPGEGTTWHAAFWWIHISFVFIFISYLPFSKLFHIFAGAANIALETVPPDVLTLEERESLKQEFSRRHIIASDACTRCNRCENKCPSNQSGEALSPRAMNQRIKEHLRSKYSMGNFAKALLKKPLPDMQRETVIQGEEAWMCTTCRACVEECPITIDSLGIIREMRALKVEEGTQVPTMVGDTLESVFKYGNPYQGPKNKRIAWAQDLEVKDFSKGEAAEMLYFVGCASSYDDRLQKIAQTAVAVFKKVGLDIGVLGNKESCCGEPAKRLGEDGLLEEVIMKNYELFEQFGIRDVIMSCPHGLKMFKEEYPLYKTKLEIETEGVLRPQHHTEVLSRLVKEKRLVFSKELRKRVTYHDPCYLGRHLGIYEPPREIIKAIPGIDFVEMDRSRRNSFCCGGGGGRLWMEEFEAKEKISEIRVRDAAAVQAHLLITSCPYCMSMLEDAVKTAGYEERLEVKDLLELIVDLI